MAEARALFFRVRVHPEERDHIHARARAAGFENASDWVRELMGLPALNYKPADSIPKMQRAAKKAPRKPRKPPAKPNPQVEELAMRLHNREGLTMPVARRKARQMLGVAS